MHGRPLAALHTNVSKFEDSIKARVYHDRRNPSAFRHGECQDESFSGIVFFQLHILIVALQSGNKIHILEESKMTDMDCMLKELNRIANALERIANACEMGPDRPIGKAGSSAESCLKRLSSRKIV